MTNDDEIGVSGKTLAVLASVALLVAGLFVGAWAIRTMWGWFVTPSFGVAVPSRSATVGVWMLVSLMRYRRSEPREDSIMYGLTSQLGFILTAPLFVAIGWLVHRFM